MNAIASHNNQVASHNNTIETILASISALSGPDQIALYHKLPKELRSNTKDVNIERVVVSPQIALNYLEFNQYDIQRPKKEQHIQGLAKEMHGKRWLPDSIIQFGYVGKKTFLIDGQNRLESIVRTGIPQTVLVLHRHFENMEQLRQAYAVIDGGMKRSTNDVLKALMYGINTEITPSEQRNLISALRVLISGFQTTSARTKKVIPLGLMVPLVLQFDSSAKRFFESLVKVVDGKKQRPTEVAKRLKGSPIMAVALLTFEHMPEKAKVFWPLVAAGTGAENSPAKRLHDFILENTVDAVNVGVFARIVAKAWNRYEIKETIKQPLTTEGISHNDPIRIKGSAFTGQELIVLTLGGEFVNADNVEVEAEFPAPRKGRNHQSPALAAVEAQGQTALFAVAEDNEADAAPEAFDGEAMAAAESIALAEAMEDSGLSDPENDVTQGQEVIASGAVIDSGEDISEEVIASGASIQELERVADPELAI